MPPPLSDAASHTVKGYRRALPLSNSGWSMRMFTSNACIVRQRPVHTIALGLEREQHSMLIRVDIMASRIHCSYLQRFDALQMMRRLSLFLLPTKPWITGVLLSAT